MPETSDIQDTPAKVEESKAPATGENEALGEPGKAALVAERQKVRELTKQLRDLEAKAKDSASDGLAGIRDELKALTVQFETERRERLRLETASQHGIPREYLHLLTADTEDALVEQAKTVADLVKLKSTPAFAPNPAQGRRSAEGARPSVESGRELYRQHHPRRG